MKRQIPKARLTVILQRFAWSFFQTPCAFRPSPNCINISQGDGSKPELQSQKILKVVTKSNPNNLIKASDSPIFPLTGREAAPPSSTSKTGSSSTSRSICCRQQGQYVRDLTSEENQPCGQGSQLGPRRLGVSSTHLPEVN